MRRAVAFMIAALSCAALSAQSGRVRAQQTPRAPSASQGAATPALVRIDAVVTDARGRAVRDLTAADFSIVEDSQTTAVESATFVAADATAPPSVVPVVSRADERAEAAKAGARLFAVFLDEYHVSPGAESASAREAVSAVIERDFGPRDLGLVVKPLDSLLTLALTHDRAALLGAIAGFEGRKGDYTPKNSFEENYFAAAPQRIEEVRSQIVTSALNAMATHMGALAPGRKTLLLVSDGFQRAPRRREEALPTVESVARTANRMGVSIYAIAPGALAAGAPASAPPTRASASTGAAPAGPAPAGATPDDRDVLRALAAGTDGKAAVSPGEGSGVLARAAADSSGYYLLSFHPAHPGDARTFHSVDVRVRRPGVTVHARPGYVSASPDDVVRARRESRIVSTPPPQPMRHVSPLIRPWFGVARATEADAARGQMAVSFVWDPVPPVPGDRVKNGPPALVSVKATRTTDGAVVFEGDARPTTASGDGAPQQLTFSTPPGRLLLQLQIQDADANVLDTDVRDVIVGALAGPVEVGTPEVFRAENARAFRALDGPDAVPVGTREFSRGDRLLVRLPVYGGAAPLTVTATLASKAGGAMRSLDVASAEAGQYQTDLPLAGLPVGEYSITIAAESADGKASETIPFRVVP